MIQSRAPRKRFDVWLRYPDGYRSKKRTIHLKVDQDNHVDLAAAQKRQEKYVAAYWRSEGLPGPVPAVEIEEAPTRW